jgi:hypothetical protein
MATALHWHGHEIDGRILIGLALAIGLSIAALAAVRQIDLHRGTAPPPARTPAPDVIIDPARAIVVLPPTPRKSTVLRFDEPIVIRGHRRSRSP